MNFTVITDIERQLVRVTHVDEMSLEDMLEGRRQAGEQLRLYGYHRMLVDTREVAIGPATMDTFEVTSSLHHDLPEHFRLAILTSKKMLNDARFGENVSINRGFKVQTFTQEQNALDWLQQP